MFSFPSVSIPSLSVAGRQDPERKWGRRGARKSERAGHSGGGPSHLHPAPQMTPFSSCSQLLNLLKSADSEQRAHCLRGVSCQSDGFDSRLVCCLCCCRVENTTVEPYVTLGSATGRPASVGQKHASVGTMLPSFFWTCK